ncbi:MAG TPA: ester cyclase [Planctomycetota bacterium]
MGRSLAARIKAANTALLTEGKLESIGEFFAPDYVAHGTDQDMKGHAGIRRFLEELRRAFPDLEAGIEILVEGKSSRVAWQRTLRGTHRGDFKGFPATGRRVTWRDMVASQFQDGIITEDWVITDLAERLLLSRPS